MQVTVDPIREDPAAVEAGAISPQLPIRSHRVCLRRRLNRFRTLMSVFQ